MLNRLFLLKVVLNLLIYSSVKLTSRSSELDDMIVFSFSLRKVDKGKRFVSGGLKFIEIFISGKLLLRFSLAENFC